MCTSGRYSLLYTSSIDCQCIEVLRKNIQKSPRSGHFAWAFSSVALASTAAANCRWYAFSSRFLFLVTAATHSFGRVFAFLGFTSGRDLACEVTVATTKRGALLAKESLILIAQSTSIKQRQAPLSPIRTWFALVYGTSTRSSHAGTDW